MNRAKKLQLTGYSAFFLSGICSISSGVIVSLLQEQYGFSYGVTGTLLACMSIGNMAASFAAGMLPARLGTRNTVAILCSGYAIGYALMTLTGLPALLMLAFALLGIAKGCAINNCTVLVSENSEDRTRSMSLLHGCYALGALLCPFIIAAMARRGELLPTVTLAGLGLLLWLVFMLARLPGRTAGAGPKEKVDTSFLHNAKFWLLTGLLFCQNAAETSVTGWLVTYYRDQGILSGLFSTYTVTIMWGATMMARMLIAFVFPIRNTFRALAVMGLGCTTLYAAMVLAHQPLLAVLLLFAFAFSMAGVNPVAVAGVGKILSPASMGVMLPVAALGPIVMPWIIGLVADTVSLQAGMVCNLVPCAGILVLSIILRRMEG